MNAESATVEANGALAQQQAALLDLVRDCVLVRDLEDRITFWNRTAEELYGWSKAEAIGQVFHKLLQTQFSKSLAEIKSSLKVTGNWQGELINTTRDGRALVVSSRWTLQLDSEGTPLAILQSDGDLTESNYAQEALRLAREQLELRVQARTAELGGANEALVESQERFRQMAANIPEVFWLSNPAMTSIIYVSPAFEKIWGRPCEALYANPAIWFDAMHPEDQPRVRQHFRKMLPAEGYEHSYRVVRKDGTERWVLERGVPVPDSFGMYQRLVGVARDITEHKMLEEETLAVSEREQRRIGQDLHDDLCQQLVGIEFISRALQQQLGTSPEAARTGEIARLIREAINHTRRLARGLARFSWKRKA
jgi:PAS domain S-box-containing protein